jgi:hypothetical protein
VSTYAARFSLLADAVKLSSIFCAILYRHAPKGLDLECSIPLYTISWPFRVLSFLSCLLSGQCLVVCLVSCKGLSADPCLLSIGLPAPPPRFISPRSRLPLLLCLYICLFLFIAPGTLVKAQCDFLRGFPAIIPHTINSFKLYSRGYRSFLLGTCG